MIQETIKNQIIAIWDNYIANNKIIQDNKGNGFENLDEKRLVAIVQLKSIIINFLTNKIDSSEFKTSIDSYNKQNNFWGFTSVKGQMFFNLLLKTCENEEQITKLNLLLKRCISEPNNLNDALAKIEELDNYTTAIFSKAPDKRKAPNPGSVCYFLSYFWQIHNPTKWPVMYSSMIVSFTEIGLWQDATTHKESYQNFVNLNEEIKQILSVHTNKTITNWEAEHSFWNFRKVTAYPKPNTKQEVIIVNTVVENTIETKAPAFSEASFNIYDYIPPITAKLIEIGAETESTGAAKGSNYEKAVVEIFKQLGFDEVIHLGQGKGNEPDIIVKQKVEGIAFIIDAKGYANGYNLNTADDRAIRDYISRNCAKLNKEGIRKIGFIIVSNSFKSDFDIFVNDITWNTDIKRFKLLTSDALLHLLAYKFKGIIQLPEIIESLIGFGNIIYKSDIIQKYDDI
jgi:hypothetical protein